MQNHWQTTHCPACSSPAMQPFFHLAGVPVYCNVLWPTREEALRCARGDIELAFCPSCGHLFNLAFDPSRLNYDQSYENSLHFSGRFQEYAQALVTHLIERYDLRGKDIIEVGCGKGEFLSLLCRLGGNRGVGFDRSYVSGRVDSAAGRGVEFVQDFYAERYAGYPCDLLCCRHALEHIHDPAAFLTTIRKTLGRQKYAVVFFEVPNGLFTLRDLGIWDIIYEHCSYFCQESLARLFSRCGFRVREARESYEGQFLCLEADVGRSEDGLSDGLNDLEQMAQAVAVFAENYGRKVEHWRRMLEQFRRSRKRAIVWGAGSKGVTFLNTFRVREGIDYVVDINPHKQGLHVAGTGQEIVPPQFLETYRPAVVLVMNPIYREEIARQLAGLGLEAELFAV